MISFDLLPENFELCIVDENDVHQASFEFLIDEGIAIGIGDKIISNELISGNNYYIIYMMTSYPANKTVYVRRRCKCLKIPFSSLKNYFKDEMIRRYSLDDKIDCFSKNDYFQAGFSEKDIEKYNIFRNKEELIIKDILE